MTYSERHIFTADVVILNHLTEQKIGGGYFRFKIVSGISAHLVVTKWIYSAKNGNERHGKKSVFHTKQLQKQ
jgi:hypothetical protein